MTVVEHLYELRYRLGWVVVAIIIGSIIGCLWFRWTIAPIPTLGSIVEGPYCSLPKDRLLGGLAAHNCGLLQTQPFEAFKTLLKVGITAGVVLSSPAWLYQIWAFITPGLRPKERRLGTGFVAAGSLLFVIGAVIAYFVLPEALNVLTGVAGSDVVAAFTISSYVGFLINLLVIFGVSFEIPLLVVGLNFVGVLKYAKLKNWRRGIIFALFVFAAIATPGSDPISMVALAGALTVLVELALQIARIHDRRVERRRIAEGWDTSDPDTASTLDYEPEPILAAPTPSPTPRPSPRPRVAEPVEPVEPPPPPVDPGPYGRWDDAT